MASTCRSSLRLLPNTVVRRRSGRARSLALPSRSQCENCICNTAAPLWRERARHGHAYRHFSVSAVESGDTNISAGQASRVESPPTARNANHKSLHSSAHSLLKVRFGHMKESEVAEARAFISIISKWHNEEGATLCEALLERLFTEQKSSNSGIIVDTEMYNICMDSWCKSNADGGKIANRVQSIMQRMEERYFGRNNDHPKKSAKQNAARPDNWSYNCLINAYSKWEVDSSAKVEEVLEKMTALAKGAASSSNALDQEYAMRIQPDTFTYNSLMNYYASRENDHRAARRAEDLLLHMSELAKGEGDIRMDTTSFNIVLKAWSNSGGGIYGAERAESMLRRMIKLYGGGHENVRPNAVSFSTVINSYARVDPEDTPLAREKVMGILDVIEGSYFPDSCDISACYAAAANVIVKSGADDAVERVQELMYRMKNMDAIPDRKINASLVEALGNKGSDESFRLAIDHLSEMSKQRVSDLDKDAVIPFNMLLRSVLREDSSTKMQKAEEIFALMDNLGGFFRPDVSSYNMVISELSRSTAKDDEQKAVGHLRNMLKSYRDGYEPAKPDSFAFNCIISMLARSKQGEWADDVIYKTLMAMENHQKRNPSVKPDTITFNLAIGRLAKTFSKQNAKKVMKLLVMMEETATCNPALAPDILTYTSVLSIQTRVDPRRAADVASTYLQREMSKGRGMQVDRPGIQSILHALSRSRQFDHAMLSWRAWKWIEDSDKGRVILDSALCNLVFIGFSHSDGPEGAENSLLFLSERMKRHKENRETAVLPTNVGFSACLSTLAKADRIDDAIRVLEIMKVLTRDGVPNTRLDAGCYNSILTNLAREASKNVAPHAIKVVHHMKENLGEVPTAPLNSAINACSRISQNARPIVRSEALDIASKLFQWGGESSSRDSVTFGLMIRTCSKLAGDDIKRYKLVEHLFKLSAKSGLVGNMVMREISKSPELKKILIGDRELPKEWSVNATDY